MATTPEPASAPARAPLRFTLATFTAPQTDANVLAAARVPALVHSSGSLDCAALLATVPLWDACRPPGTSPPRVSAYQCSDHTAHALAAALGPAVWGPHDLADAGEGLPAPPASAGTPPLEAFWTAFGVAHPAVLVEDPPGTATLLTPAALTPFFATELVLLLSGLFLLSLLFSLCSSLSL